MQIFALTALTARKEAPAFFLDFLSGPQAIWGLRIAAAACAIAFLCWAYMIYRKETRQ